MAHRSALTCARCDKRMESTNRSRPQGQAVCHSCRREQRSRNLETGRPATCPSCGTAFVSKPYASNPNTWRLVCSDACARARIASNVRRLNGAPAQPEPCDGCGEPTARGRNQEGRFCAGCSRSRRRAKDRRAAAVRRGAAVAGPRPLLEDIALRDGWRCHLCARPVDAALYFQHRDAATLDHLVPVSVGGTDEAANLALAHRGCNSRRGTGGLVQLALI